MEPPPPLDELRRLLRAGQLRAAHVGQWGWGSAGGTGAAAQGQLAGLASECIGLLLGPPEGGNSDTATWQLDQRTSAVLYAALRQLLPADPTAAVVHACACAAPELAAEAAGADGEARALLERLAALRPRGRFVLCAAVLGDATTPALLSPGGGAQPLLWGPLLAAMTGAPAPGDGITRRERAEGVASWLASACAAVRRSGAAGVRSEAPAAVLQRWLRQEPAAGASAGAAVPQTTQTRLLRQAAALAVLVDAESCEAAAEPWQEGPSVTALLQMLSHRALRHRCTLDAWAAAIHALSGTESCAANAASRVRAVAPSLEADLIELLLSNEHGDLSGAAARVLTMLLAAECTDAVQPGATPSTQAAQHGMQTLCATLLKEVPSSRKGARAHLLARSSLAHGRLCAALLPPLCKAAPPAVGGLLDGLIGGSAPHEGHGTLGLRCALEVAWAAQNAGGKAAAMALERVPIGSVEDALSHADEGIRLAALKLSCRVAGVSPRRNASSALCPDKLFAAMRKQLRYTLYDPSRQKFGEFAGALSGLLRQIRDSIVPQGPKPTPLKRHVLAWAEQAVDWCSWFRTFLFRGLGPGAPYWRAAVYLDVLAEFATLFWTPTLATNGESQQRQELLGALNRECDLDVAQEELDAMLVLLESTYPRLRELAFEVLLRLRMPALAIRHAKVCDCEKLMRSHELRKYDAGALIHRVLWLRRGEGGWWQDQSRGLSKTGDAGVDMYEYVESVFAHSTAPHGSVRALRYLLEDEQKNTRNEDSAECECWRDVLRRVQRHGLLALQQAIPRVETLGQTSVSAAADQPALLSGPTDLGTDASAADAVLEATELCRLLGTLVVITQEQTKGLSGPNDLEQVLVNLLSACTIMPQMGALSAVAETLESVGIKLLSCVGCTPLLNAATELLAKLSGRRVLRRSTGISAAFLALLRPMARSRQRQLQTKTAEILRDLICCAQSGESVARLAALDSLTLALRDRDVVVAAQRATVESSGDTLSHALELAIRVQAEPSWGAHNSAAQLFAVVSQRLAGNGGKQLGNDDSRSTTLGACLAGHTRLATALVALTRLHSAEFHVLTFLSLFKPSGSTLDQSDTAYSELRAYAERCSCSRSLRLRVAAAGALAALTPVDSTSSTLEAVVRHAVHNSCGRKSNATHGVLLQARMLVRSARLHLPSDRFDAVSSTCSALFDLECSDPLSRQAVVDIIEECEQMGVVTQASVLYLQRLVAEVALSDQDEHVAGTSIGMHVCKRLGIAATRSFVRMSLNSRGSNERWMATVTRLFNHDCGELRWTSIRGVKWQAKHRGPLSQSVALWAQAQAIERVCAPETLASVQKQLLRLLLLLDRDGSAPLGVAHAKLAPQLWAWCEARVCFTTRALALQLLGLSQDRVCDLVAKLADAASANQPLYLRGAAAESLFQSGALHAAMPSVRLRGWLLASALLQDDDVDVRERARTGLTAALCARRASSQARQPSPLHVLELAWQWMGSEFGHLAQYRRHLRSVVDEVPQSPAGADGGEEGANIFADRSVARQLAASQLREIGNAV